MCLGPSFFFQPAPSISLAAMYVLGEGMSGPCPTMPQRGPPYKQELEASASFTQSPCLPFDPHNGYNTLEFPAYRACLQACRAHFYSQLPGDCNHGSWEDMVCMWNGPCHICIFWSLGRNAIPSPSSCHHQLYVFSSVILHFLSTNIKIFVLIGVGWN